MDYKEPTIKKIWGREILDSRGNPTLEVTVLTDTGVSASADAPAGRSTGTYEAKELRDGGTRYDGLGVEKAVETVNRTVNQLLVGKVITDQRDIDYTMIEFDGTNDKSKLGGNTMVATSLAVAKAAARSLSIPLYRYIGGVNAHVLPIPMFLYICGGKLAATDLDFQELNALPVGAKSFKEALQMGSEVYHKLGRLLASKYSKYSLNTGDEGSFSPPGMNDPRDGFEMILKSIEDLGYNDKFVLAIDAAANSFYNSKTGMYLYRGKEISKEKLFEEYSDLASTYPLRSIEDPFQEDDFDSTSELTKALRIQIVGDDLFVTNKERLKKGIEKGAANALLFKINQIGTLTEALETAELAKSNKYNIVVSERSAQTEDVWLAEVAVSLNAGQLKNGAPARGERISQFNRLLRIEEELVKRASYGGNEKSRLLI